MGLSQKWSGAAGNVKRVETAGSECWTDGEQGAIQELKTAEQESGSERSHGGIGQGKKRQ